MATKPHTITIQQPDLFGAPAQTVGVVTVDPARAKPRHRKVHETQRAAHREITRTAKGPSAAARCRWDINGNSKLGRTRQEIANRTDIKLQTVCGCVDRLLKAGTVFEPIIGYTEAGKFIHYVRDGGKVLVNALYRDSYDWIAFGHRLREEPAA